MELFRRAKSILIRPKETWLEIRDEEKGVKDLLLAYACILAAIPGIVYFMNLSVIGIHMPFLGVWKQPLLKGLGHAALFYILSLAGLFVTAFVANILGGCFGSKKDFPRAMGAVVYSSTASWIAGILNIVPGLSTVVWILSLYSLYLLFLGLPVMMETPPEQKTGYAAVVVVVSVLVMAAVSLMSGLFLAGSALTVRV